MVKTENSINTEALLARGGRVSEFSITFSREVIIAHPIKCAKPYPEAFPYRFRFLQNDGKIFFAHNDCNTEFAPLRMFPSDCVENIEIYKDYEALTSERITSIEAQWDCDLWKSVLSEIQKHPWELNPRFYSFREIRGMIIPSVHKEVRGLIREHRERSELDSDFRYFHEGSQNPSKAHFNDPSAILQSRRSDNDWEILLVTLPMNGFRCVVWRVINDSHVQYIKEFPYSHPDGLKDLDAFSLLS